MAKDPRDQQQTDARRIGDTGTGKTDQDTAATTPPAAGTTSPAAGPVPGAEEARRRVLDAREEAIAELRRLGVAPDVEESGPRGSRESVLDVGDVAQASLRADFAVATRQRLAERINHLTRALERIQRGTWGRCTVCGREIERERRTAMPEADTCRACQEQLERTRTARGAEGRSAA